MSAFARAVDVQLKSILVASDFTPVSEKALRHAVAIARYFGSKLYFMHVVNALGLSMVGPEAIARATQLAWRDSRLAQSRLEASGLLDGIPHELVMTDGEIWEEIEQVIHQNQIEMLVIGTHSRTGLSKLMLGSVAEQIFRHATCPVLSVGPHAPSDDSAVSTTTQRPLLFPTDFGENSLAALPYALSFAQQRRTR
jgi:nucleotide-binding universal stress UspA family protein